MLYPKIYCQSDLVDAELPGKQADKKWRNKNNLKHFLYGWTKKLLLTEMTAKNKTLNCLNILVCSPNFFLNMVVCK